MSDVFAPETRAAPWRPAPGADVDDRYHGAPAASAESEISLRELFEILWRGKMLILGVALVLGIAAGVTAKLLPKRYSASIVTSPVSDEAGRMAGVGSVLSQYGGIASLAGFSVPANSQREETIAVLSSEALVDRYIRENHLMPILFADQWDAAAQHWKVSDPRKVPTLWQADQFFISQVRSISENAKTGMVTLTVTWTDPVLAARWANGLVAMTNDYLRGKAIQESERDISFLNAQADQNTKVEVQKAIYTLLESQIKRAMLARGSAEYALKVMDPAVSPERPSFPKPRVWALVGFLGGLIFSGLYVCGRAALRRGR
jgi:uncharacterized protein involved in exopolysaccharide biosynthesis